MSLENKRIIDPFQFAEKSLSNDLIIAAKMGETVNIMALGWKTLGILWSQPVWIVAVRPSRYTFRLLNEHPEFSLHLMPDNRDDIISLAGSKSGKNTDKVKELGLNLIESKKISVPLIDEALISYECKIIHTAESGDHSPHRLFFGKILKAYADKSLF